MTQKEILEGNRLIAEFYGDTFHKAIEIGFDLVDICWKHGEDYYENLHYHTSWDWLMPCCIKIIRVSPEKCALLKEYLGDCNIDKVYKQLIFLIKNLD